jgi:hypothetical protein
MPKRNWKWTEENDARIKKLLDEGKSIAEIADAIGHPSPEAVRDHIRFYIKRHVNKGPQNDSLKEEKSYEQGQDFINVICASRRMLSKEDIVDEFNIDLNEWEIERFRVRTSEGYRKDRKVDWHVKEGRVTRGDVDDSGKMLVVPLYHIEVRFKRKSNEIEARNILVDLLADAKKFAPKYPKIVYPKLKDPCLYEIAMYDLHFGRLTWDEESGENYDIKISEKLIKSAFMKLLAAVKDYSVERILFPVGNDFFNVDSKFNTTTAGTPQQEDTRWQKTFRRGREICVSMIDQCSQIAPVDVLIIPGNHDQQRSFYLGEVLSAWYQNNKQVTIDNRSSIFKYYVYGNVLLGFTHGNDIKLEKLPFVMANDNPEQWARSKYREWHTGDKHHKKGLTPFEDEGSGMLVRIIRSLVPYDAWTFNSGYRSLRAAESFLWSKSEGLKALFTAMPE